ncbi:carbohydrate ABC transporter permease [Occultella glacieicola]|uniref:Carbohydrate ABC transporter permease n=2 Tax=Occultella glacieicola TaxID=2518684 RepID=A0ABY2E2J5_9MICO|nr:carbohydrate ABC transporter permease [Occultella glacieicola]
MRAPLPERILRVVVIVVALVLAVGPVLYGVVLSIRPFSAVLNAPLDLFPSPSEWDFSSFGTALADEADGGFGLGRFIRNSLLLALGTVVASLLVSVLGAYAAARLRYKGRGVVNGIILSVYLLPGIVLAVPLFVMLSRVGLTGNLVGLLIVYVSTTVPVAIYMVRNYFIALPESVEEAAIIDGCSLPVMLWRVVLPIAAPGVAATAIYVFMIAWNEYLFALLFLVQKRELWTAPLGLSQLTEISVPVTVLLAGSIIVTVPVVVLFFIFQRFLVSGLTTGAEK